MGYTITYRGRPVECHTPQDVDALLDLEAPNGTSRRKQRRGSPKSIKGLVKALPEEQKKLLQLLATTSPLPMTDKEIREAMQLASNKKLAGLLSGIHKAVKRAGSEVDNLILKDLSRSTSGDRTYRYRLEASKLADIQAGLSAK